MTHSPKDLKVLIIISKSEEYMKLTIAAFKIMRWSIFFYFEFPFQASIIIKNMLPKGFKNLNHLYNCKLIKKLSYHKQITFYFIWLVMTRTTNTKGSKLALTYYLGHDPCMTQLQYKILEMCGFWKIINLSGKKKLN